MWSFHNVLAHDITLFEDRRVGREVHLEGGGGQSRAGQGRQSLRTLCECEHMKCMNKVGEYVHVCMWCVCVCVCARNKMADAE